MKTFILYIFIKIKVCCIVFIIHFGVGIFRGGVYIKITLQEGVLTESLGTPTLGCLHVKSFITPEVT